MRKLFLTISSIALVFQWVSCKKNNDPIIATATTLNIVNALPGTSGLIVNINDQLPFYLGQPAVGYKVAGRYSFAGGNTHILLRDNADTTSNVFSQNTALAANTIYSLFIMGNAGSAESLLTKDTLPYHGPQGHGTADSVVGIRFINLSAGSTPVSVNITGNASGSAVSSLAYKSITGFQHFAVTAGVASYTFEFRDPATDSILASYTLPGVNNGINGNGALNNVLFKNMTIALVGTPGSQSAMKINNY